MKRSPVKRKTVKRYWADAVAKRDSEQVCRVCRRTPSGEFGDRLEIAHVSGRKYDRPYVDDGVFLPSDVLYVDPVDIVPLCTSDHLAFDANELDLLPFLTPDEQAAAVLNLGGAISMLKRVCPMGGTW